MKLLKLFKGIYIVSISLILYIILKPILLVFKKILSKEKYISANYILISIVNYFYFLDMFNQKKFNKIKSNIRKYRDIYDRNGLDLYLKNLSKEELFENKSILDLGCGVGGKCFEIANKFNPKKVLGIDLSKRNIKYAKELINKKNKDILNYEYKNLFDIKEDKVFDTIISFTVFEHIDIEILLDILNKCNDLLIDNGNLLIVFNHYNDKFGSHLKEYIYHPWPQALFDEEIIFSYWNYKLKNDPIMNEDSYFPPEYHHGTDGHNSDCFMNLNKLDIKGFEEIIKQSKLNYVKRTESKILKYFPFLPKKYLEGSVVYHLKKGNNE